MSPTSYLLLYPAIWTAKIQRIPHNTNHCPLIFGNCPSQPFFVTVSRYLYTMGKHFKKLIYTILALGAIFIAATVSINFFLKKKLETYIEKRLPENMLRSYDAISVQSFGGSLVLDNASLILQNRADGQKHTFINVEKLKISAISYWDYFFNDEIHIDHILLENPTIVYYKDRMKPSKDTVRRAIVQIYKPIVVDRVQIENTQLAI